MTDSTLQKCRVFSLFVNIYLRGLYFVDFCGIINYLISEIFISEVCYMLKNNIEVDIKVKCIEAGLTQAQLAENIETTSSYVLCESCG